MVGPEKGRFHNFRNASGSLVACPRRWLAKVSGINRFRNRPGVLVGVVVLSTLSVRSVQSGSFFIRSLYLYVEMMEEKLSNGVRGSVVYILVAVPTSKHDRKISISLCLLSVFDRSSLRLFVTYRHMDGVYGFPGVFSICRHRFHYC